MSTAARLESSVAGGIKGIKLHMKQMQDSIKEKIETAERMEKENEKAKLVFLKAYGRQQAMREKMTNIEEKLVKNEQKLKDMTRRVNEKERFLEESRKFNKDLKTVVPDEDAVTGTEERLKGYKELYAKNYDLYQRSRNRKIELEQKAEIAEMRAHEATRRYEALKLQLEYNSVEEGRRTEGCKDAIDSAFKCEKGCLDLQSGMDVIMKRKEIATQKINSLEARISKVECSTDTMAYDRKRMEATIRELLVNIKNQNKK